MSPHEHSPSTLTTRIAEADPADLDAATLHTAGALARAAASGATPTRTGLRRPVLIASLAGGLALTGGIAAATTGVLDLFGPDAPVIATVPMPAGVPGAAGEQCEAVLNVIPSDGTEQVDASGVSFGTSGSAETFDADDFAATVAFLESHDWSGTIADVAAGRVTVPEGAVGTRTGPDGDEVTVGGPDGEDADALLLGGDGGLSIAVMEVLTEAGLNLTGSASIVGQVVCDGSDLG